MYNLGYFKQLIEITDSLLKLDVASHIVHFDYGEIENYEFFNTNPMDMIFKNVSFFTDDAAMIDTYAYESMASITKKDFDEDTYLIKFDSEDKRKFEWNLVFENCTFRNLYRYYALYFFDELEKISFTFRNNVVENVVTYESPMMIEASNLYIYDCTFRKVKSKGQGGAMFQKYSVDGLD